MDDKTIKAKRQTVKILEKELATSLKNGITPEGLEVRARAYLGACLEIYPTTIESAGELRIFGENCIYFMLRDYGYLIQGDDVYYLHQAVINIILRVNATGVYNPLDASSFRD